MGMISEATTERLIAKLYRVKGKAEIVGGRIVCIDPAGDLPAYAAGTIVVSLSAMEKSTDGVAFASTVAFLTDLPNRKSFCPDASFYTGPRTGMKFPSIAPVFAVEVRNDGEYGSAFELEIREKIRDYFAAGTKVVWDVDLESDEVVRVYRAGSQDSPTIYRRGETAEAEPAVPGWKMPVDELFE